jgi:hypothetical protein
MAVPIHHVDVREHSAAGPAAVYALLRDGSTWPDWSPIEEFKLERPGTAEPEGLGAIRNFRTGRHRMREQIVELVPDRRFSYTLLAGLAIRDYRVDVDLTPAGTGTDIHWHAEFRAKVPGTGGLYHRTLQRVIANFVTGLAAHAARSHDDDARTPH